MKIKLFILLTLSLIFAFLILTFNFSFGVSAQYIIDQIDANMTYGSAYFESKMIIHVGDEIREKRLFSYAKGKDKSFSKFTYPARDKGVKYLKIEDNMWIYMPSVEDTIKIAGHMLRQSMMGSDLSYEDALESSKLRDKYDAFITGEETISVTYPRFGKEITKKFNCYVIELIAKVKKVTYYKRKIWVDKTTYVPIRSELFAKSGKKLKVQTLADIRSFGNRYYAMYFTMKNLLRKNSLTEMVITKAQFDIKLDESIFTLRNLSK